MSGGDCSILVEFHFHQKAGESFDSLKEEILIKFEELHQMIDARKQVVMSKLLAIKEEAERTTQLDEGIDKLKQAKEMMIATLTDNVIGEERQHLESNFDDRIKEAENRKLSEKSCLVNLRCYVEKLQEDIKQIDLVEELPVYANKAAPIFRCRKPGFGRGEFKRPRGICMDSATSQVYIVDAGYKSIKVVDSRDGSYINEFGAGYYLTNPFDITLTNQCVFVTDQGQHSIVKFTIDGGYDCKVGSKGTALSQFNMPQGITSEASTLYICDFHNKRIQVLDTELKYVSTVKAPFGPIAIRVSATAIHVMGQSSNTVYMYSKFTTKLLRTIQLTGQEYKMQTCHFFAVDAAGNYLVSAHYENSIRIFDNEGVLRHTLGHIGYPLGILVLSNNNIICVNTGDAYRFHIY